MKKILLITCHLLLITLISSCSQKQKETWGLTKEAPNEFLVVSRAPLTLPPDYDLRPINENMMTNQEDVKYQDLSSDERDLMKKIDSQKTNALPDDEEILVDEGSEEIDRELQTMQDAAPLIDDTNDINDVNPQGE